MNNEDHPSEDRLLSFAQGKLDRDALEEVARHVESCPDCLDFLERSREGTLVDQLREAARDSDLGEQSFEFNQTLSFSAAEEQTDLESVLSEHSKYRLLEKIGSGGMGAVFKARHRIMDRDVAIKIIRSDLVSHPEAVARFHTEVRAAARLAHRNIVAAYDAEQVGSAHFLVMELVEGESLAETVQRKGPLPVTNACNYILQVAHGLRHADELGMIHRDIKPQNLMKTPKGIIKILDFGLARIAEIEQESQLTSTGVMMGTADYIAPEQARNARAADIRSDLYSLGCTFYCLLAGEAPFRASGSRVDKILAHCTNRFPDPRDHRNDIPSGVISILQALVEKDPADRIQTPAELIQLLTPFGKPAAEPNREGNAESRPANPVHELPPQGSPLETRTSGEKASGNQASGKQGLPLSTGKPIQGKTAENGATVDPNAHPSLPATNRKKKPLGLLAAGSAISLGLLLILWFAGFLGGSADPSGKDATRQTVSQDSTGVDSPERTVAVFFGYEKFSYGDYGPLRDRLEEDNIRVVTASTHAGRADYFDFSGDQTPNKQNVQLDYDLAALMELAMADRIDAVVFIGGDQRLPNLTNSSSAEARKIRKTCAAITESGGWIAAIGRGMNIPYALGLLDESRVVDSTWLDQPNRPSVQAQPDAPVLFDVTRRVITARSWENSAELAQSLVDQWPE